MLLHGATHDLFFDGESYVPLVPFLVGRCGVPGVTQLVCELNGPIRISPPDRLEALRDAWIAWRSGVDLGDFALRALVDRQASRERAAHEREFDRLVQDAAGAPTLGMEFLRQLCLMRRAKLSGGRPTFGDTLLIWIEAADLLVPNAGDDVGRLSPSDRHRVSILRDWFGDAAFQDGDDSVILISESRGGRQPIGDDVAAGGRRRSRST